ncbi:MAG: undecaprenyldiphospho-muramoylpentapeptide beta-N-acetylglucosaminyltransferase [Desulfobulbaceae bacterium]|nr:undecaprenyldiphospho-muramoylpentapeptide beta-N-acetylglucosaminyltransferase [Desulfobulbaceae bacterium]
MAVVQKKGITLVITGGGTGGHIFPGVAVAQALIAKMPAARVIFIGTDRAVDQNAMAQYGFASRAVPCGALKGGTLSAKLKTLARLPWSLYLAWRVLGQIKPDAVLGVGGYVTGPVVLAAKLSGIPTCIHEQNSVPGLANRKLGAIVDRIFISIPGSERYFKAEKCRLTGNPLRHEILALAQNERPEGNKPVVLVLGGSQGAHRLNTLLPEALSGCRRQCDFTVIHQTGRTDEKSVRAAYLEAGIEAEVAAFFTDMTSVYAKASLVVSRAGATTLAELTALGKASILIPFPFAADDHQTKNAEALVAGGAARMFIEKDLQAETLGKEIIGILTDQALHHAMGQAAKRLAKPEAVDTILAECLRLAKWHDADDKVDHP